MNSQKNNVKDLKPLYSCGVCKDQYWVVDFKGKATRCKCFEMVMVKEQWEASGLKIEDLEKTLSAYRPFNETTRTMKWNANKYCAMFNDIKGEKYNSILMVGEPGSGKTHLSIAIANNLIQAGNKVVYMPYRDIITKLKMNMLDSEFYNKTINKYKEADVLLIDDLFKGKVNETDINIMFEIVNHRYINRKPIIVSSEYLIENMLNFDTAIGSRIYEMAKNFTVQAIGTENNYRLREAGDEV